MSNYFKLNSLNAFGCVWIQLFFFISEGSTAAAIVLSRCLADEQLSGHLDPLSPIDLNLYSALHSARTTL